jgi:hypothetical protein
MQSRLVPVILLIASAAGMLWFSQRLTVTDTVALLACGVVAGCSLAALAATRTRGTRA